MEFIIRKNGNYLDVKIKEVGIELEFGLHNERDCKELALVLLEAATTLIQNVKESS